MSSHLRQARLGLSLAFAVAALLAIAHGLARAADEKTSAASDTSAQSEDQAGDKASAASDQESQSSGNQSQDSKGSRTSKQDSSSGQKSAGSGSGDTSDSSSEDTSSSSTDGARKARGGRSSEEAQRNEKSGAEFSGRGDELLNPRADYESESGTRERQTRSRPQRPSQEDRFEDDDRGLSQSREGDLQRAHAGSRGGFRGDFGLAFGGNEEGGLSVSRVTGNSLASRAGLRRGDIVVSVNGRRFASDDDFHRWVNRFGANDEISIVVLRDGRRRTLFADPKWTGFEGSRVDYETADEPDYRDYQTRSTARGRAYLGVVLDTRYPNAALVLEAHPDSPADEAGLRQGDIIRKVNGQSINSPDELSDVISQMRPGEDAEIEYSRRRNSSVGVELGERPEAGSSRFEDQDQRSSRDRYDEQFDDAGSFRDDSNRLRGRSSTDEAAELRRDERGRRDTMREDDAGVRVRGQGGPLQRLFRD